MSSVTLQHSLFQELTHSLVLYWNLELCRSSSLTGKTEK